MTETAIKKVETQPLATHTTAVNVLEILQRAATDPNCDVDKLAKLLDLHERVSDRAAATEFAAALAAFQATCPEIPKTREVTVTTKAGGKYSYMHANLQDIVTIVRPALNAVGLSFTFDAETNGGNVLTTCWLRHVNGHAVPSRSSMPIDGSPGMSAAQKNETGATFGQKQSLTQSLGIITSDAGPPQDDPGPVLSDVQRKEIERLLKDTETKEDSFLAWADADSVAEIRQGKYTAAISFFKVRAAQQKKES